MKCIADAGDVTFEQRGSGMDWLEREVEIGQEHKGCIYGFRRIACQLH